MNKYQFAMLLGAVLFLMGCSTTKKTINSNYSYLYAEEPAVIRPSYHIFHTSTAISKLYFKFRSNDILYAKVAGDTTFTARLEISYKLYAWGDKKTIIDSASTPLVDVGSNEKQKDLYGDIDLTVPSGGKYRLEVMVKDINRDLSVLNYVKVDKRNNVNRQYFLLREPNGMPHFGLVIKERQPLKIQKSALITNDVLIAKFAPTNFKQAPPPFSLDPPEEILPAAKDSIQIPFIGNEASWQTNESGYYFIHPEDNNKQGFYLYFFHAGYPALTSEEQLIAPIRYITTSKEYNKISNALNPKKAVDEFWVKIGNNEERSKEVLKKYYERVEKTNRYFTSYKAGWKTDRGIIYLIYGPPSSIYKTATSENWVYGDEGNMLSTTFRFYLKDSPYSNNDYRLVRNYELKDNWYRAVDSWRQGRVY